MSRASAERGFTLVELLISMSIGVMAFSGILGGLSVMLRQSTLSRQQAEAQSQARSAMDRIALGLRNAMAAPGTSPTAIERAADDDIVFQAVDPGTAPSAGNKLGARRIRYCLDATDTARSVLRMQTQAWTTASAPAVPSATACNSALNGWDDNRQIASDLVNQIRTPLRPTFTYGPTGWAALANVRSVEMNLAVDTDPSDVRGERVLTSGVSLRNANRPPAVAISIAQGGGFVTASGTAVDEDGDSLSYQWYLDGTLVASATQIRYAKSGLATGTSHVFRLVATDPSGLSGEASRTVIVQ